MWILEGGGNNEGDVCEVKVGIDDHDLVHDRVICHPDGLGDSTLGVKGEPGLDKTNRGDHALYDPNPL